MSIPETFGRIVDDLVSDDPALPPVEPIQLDPVVWLSGLVYLATFLEFGAGWWRALGLALVVMLATKFHYGRRTLMKAGVVLLLLTCLSVTGLLPALDRLPSLMLATAQKCIS